MLFSVQWWKRKRRTKDRKQLKRTRELSQRQELWPSDRSQIAGNLRWTVHCSRRLATSEPMFIALGEASGVDDAL